RGTAIERAHRTADRDVVLHQLPVALNILGVSRESGASGAGRPEVEYVEIVRTAEEYLRRHKPLVWLVVGGGVIRPAGRLREAAARLRRRIPPRLPHREDRPKVAQ